MKALTFEEWEDVFNCPVTVPAEYLFNLARQGMIEESFIGFRQKEDWPHGAKGFVTYFTDKPKREASRPWAENPMGAFTYVRRDDQPEWTPKVGEAVFVLGADWVSVLTGKVCDDEGGGKYRVAMSGVERLVFMKDLKPFDASKIGKPWEEI